MSGASTQSEVLDRNGLEVFATGYLIACEKPRTGRDDRGSRQPDSLGDGNTFSVPTVAKGHLYVGTAGGGGVFGLLP